MGIEAIGKLISYASKAHICKGVGLVSKPAITRTLEGEFKLATELIGDTCHFSHVDRSFDPEFVKGLLNIEGKNLLETLTKIKDEILKARGFKHPEALVIRDFEKVELMAYNHITGEIGINSSSMNMYPKKEQIGAIYHELDHMDKYAKLYKVIGEDKYIEMFYSKLPPRHRAVITKEIMTKEIFNKNFYERIVDDVSCDGFDMSKYCKGGRMHKTWAESHRYFNDPLEIDAYRIEKKIIEILGETHGTARENYMKYNKIYMSLMEKGGVPIQKRCSTIDDLRLLFSLKEINENQDNIRKYMRLNEMSRFKKVNYSEEDKIFMEKIDEKIAQLLRNRDKRKARMEQVEAWLRDGKYTIEDVLKDM